LVAPDDLRAGARGGIRLVADGLAGSGIGQQQVAVLIFELTIRIANSSVHLLVGADPALSGAEAFFGFVPVGHDVDPGGGDSCDRSATDDDPRSPHEGKATSTTARISGPCNIAGDSGVPAVVPARTQVARPHATTPGPDEIGGPRPSR
jgi:hypothetical protein